MRAYLPISHKELEAFVLSKSIEADEVFAPTQAFVADNLDCDEEERCGYSDSFASLERDKCKAE